MGNYLHVLFNDYFKDYLKFNPLHATVIGEHKHDDQMPNFYSEEYTTNLRDTLHKYLDLGEAGKRIVKRVDYTIPIINHSSNCGQITTDVIHYTLMPVYKFFMKS